MNVGPEQDHSINQNGVFTDYDISGRAILITQSAGIQHHTLSETEPTGYAIWTDSWTPTEAYQQLNYGSQTVDIHRYSINSFAVDLARLECKFHVDLSAVDQSAGVSAEQRSSFGLVWSIDSVLSIDHVHAETEPTGYVESLT